MGDIVGDVAEKITESPLFKTVAGLLEAEKYEVTIEEDNGGAPPVRIDGEDVVRDERIVITARKTTRAPIPV